MIAAEETQSGALHRRAVLIVLVLMLLVAIGARGADTPPPSNPASTKCTPSETLPAVVMSRQNICHLLGTNGYNQTGDARPFNSMEACVNAGGRPSKSIVYVDDCRAPDLSVEGDEFAESSWLWVVGAGALLALLIGVGWYQRLRERGRARKLDAEGRRRWGQHWRR